MNAAEQIGPQYKVPPLDTGEFWFGLEPLEDCFPEFLVLAAKEWEEVGNNERFGRYDPDLARGLEYERAGGLFLFTLRDKRTFEMVGYILLTLAPSLKQRGKMFAQESAIYLEPGAREGRPWLMYKLLRFVGRAMESMKIHYIELGHQMNPDGPRVGKLYQRLGYEPTAAVYTKVLNDA